MAGKSGGGGILKIGASVGLSGAPSPSLKVGAAIGMSGTAVKNDNGKGGIQTPNFNSLPGVARFKASIKAGAKASAADRNVDYQYATSQLNSIFGNLSTTQKGIGRKLTAQQGRALAATRNLQAKQSALGSRVAGAQQRAVSQYGSALAVSANQSFGVARANAKAAAVVGKGNVKATQATVKGGNISLKLGQQEIGAEGGAATYELNQALAARAQADAQAVVQQKQQLAQMKLQFQENEAQAKLQQQLQEKEYRYEQNFALKNPQMQVSNINKVVSSAATNGDTRAQAWSLLQNQAAANNVMPGTAAYQQLVSAFNALYPSQTSSSLSASYAGSHPDPSTVSTEISTAHSFFTGGTAPTNGLTAHSAMIQQVHDDAMKQGQALGYTGSQLQAYVTSVVNQVEVQWQKWSSEYPNTTPGNPIGTGGAPGSGPTNSAQGNALEVYPGQAPGASYEGSLATRALLLQKYLP